MNQRCFEPPERDYVAQGHPIINNPPNHPMFGEGNQGHPHQVSPFGYWTFAPHPPPQNCSMQQSRHPSSTPRHENIDAEDDEDDDYEDIECDENMCTPLYATATKVGVPNTCHQAEQVFCNSPHMDFINNVKQSEDSEMQKRFLRGARQANVKSRSQNEIFVNFDKLAFNPKQRSAEECDKRKILQSHLHRAQQESIKSKQPQSDVFQHGYNMDFIPNEKSSEESENLKMVKSHLQRFRQEIELEPTTNDVFRFTGDADSYISEQVTEGNKSTKHSNIQRVQQDNNVNPKSQNNHNFHNVYDMDFPSEQQSVDEEENSTMQNNRIRKMHQDVDLNAPPPNDVFNNVYQMDLQCDEKFIHETKNIQTHLRGNYQEMKLKSQSNDDFRKSFDLNQQTIEDCESQTISKKSKDYQEIGGRALNKDMFHNNQHQLDYPLSEKSTDENDMDKLPKCHLQRIQPGVDMKIQPNDVFRNAYDVDYNSEQKMVAENEVTRNHLRSRQEFSTKKFTKGQKPPSFPHFKSQSYVEVNNTSTPTMCALSGMDTATKSCISPKSHTQLIGNAVGPKKMLHFYKLGNGTTNSSMPNNGTQILPQCCGNCGGNFNLGDGTSESPAKFSFMSPTLSSEQKSLKQAVESVKNLVAGSTHVNKPKIKKKKPIIETDLDGFVCDNDKFNGAPFCKDTKVEARLTKSEDLVRNDAAAQKINSLSSSSIYGSTSSNDNGLFIILGRIKSTDWNHALRGLAEIIDVARNSDPEVLLPFMSIVNQRLLELLRSPRSHVCRTACQLAGHIFETMKDTRRPEFDDIVNVLLSKTADASKFIRHDANLALDGMVTHIPIFHAVRAICTKAPMHRNPLVRCACVRLLICAVVLLGPRTLLQHPNHEHSRKRIIHHLGTFLEDKNLETRKYGERLFKILAKDQNFDTCLRKYLDKNRIDLLLRALKNVKKKL